MSDSEEKKTRDSKSINIEIPAGGIGGTFRKMDGSGGSDNAGSGCCEASGGKCGSASGKDDEKNSTL